MRPADADNADNADDADDEAGAAGGSAGDVGGPLLVEGGHYTLTRGAADDIAGETVVLPDGSSWSAGTTETTQWSFAAAIDAARAARSVGRTARIGLLVGDIALPPGERPVGGAWALPASYRSLLEAAGMTDADVWVIGEAYARNQGKRRLLDEVKGRRSPEQTYAEEGWALLTDGKELRLASDASLAWGGGVRSALLLRGAAPMCPLVLAGLKRAIFQAGCASGAKQGSWAGGPGRPLAGRRGEGLHQTLLKCASRAKQGSWVGAPPSGLPGAGEGLHQTLEKYVEHRAWYALADDSFIDVKLRAAATTVAQLKSGDVGVSEHHVRVGAGVHVERFEPGDLVAPGELPWAVFLREMCALFPGLEPLRSSEEKESWSPSPPPASTSTTTPADACTARSRCSG